MGCPWWFWSLSFINATSLHRYKLPSQMQIGGWVGGGGGGVVFKRSKKAPHSIVSSSLDLPKQKQKQKDRQAIHHQASLAGEAGGFGSGCSSFIFHYFSTLTGFIMPCPGISDMLFV